MPTRYPGTAEERAALDAYIKLQRAAESVLARTSAHLRDYDLTLSQFAVLEALYHLGTLSQRDLADKLLKSPGNISIVLKRMEQRGLISRTRDAADNRYMQVCATETGRKLIAGMFERHVQIIRAEMSALNGSELDELSRLCKKLGLQGAN